MSERGFIVCPQCGKRTKVKIQPDTVLKRFPLFCPWCKKETMIDT
ncbi:MAG: conjugal transfer protein [Oscillospiraceae bacterium]|nr:conjugal transfer protein [Oscillospiraceae bacterium]